jgi:hypothetical protein
MALTLSYHLPEVLRTRVMEIADALITPLLAQWDPERTFEPAPQPRAIAEVLIEAVHDHLQGAKIGYLFKEKMKTRARVVLGKASKAGSKLEFFDDLDFIIEFNWQEWRRLSPMQRIALVDHELCHFGLEEDAEGNRDWVLEPHDIEEFKGVVQRWGLWKPDLVVFAGAVVHAHQLGLFEGSSD